MTREAQAKRLTEKAKELNLQIGRSSLALGGIYKRVVDEKLWEIEFESFEAWLAEVGDLKRSQAYSLIETHRQLAESLPEEVIDKIPLNNARDLTKIPASKLTADLVRQASEMPNRKFRERLGQVQPGLALEDREFKTFQLDKSAREMVNQAIKLARDRENLETDGAALEYICAQFLASDGAQYEAAKLAYQVHEDALDPDDLAKPPEPLAWGLILGTMERLATAFGFKKRVATSREIKGIAAKSAV